MIQEMIAETVNRKLFTVDEFYRLSELGVLPDDQRFELVRGEIIEMPIPGSRHSGKVDRLTQISTWGWWKLELACCPAAAAAKR